MDSIFGIGPMELALILIIAGVVMGPERMVRAARWLGQVVNQMQTISQNLRTQLENEVDSMDDDGQLRETLAEMKTLQREVSELRQQVQNTAVATANGAKATPTANAEPTENSILPPNLASSPASPVPDATPPIEPVPAASNGNGTAEPPLDQPQPQPQPIETETPATPKPIAAPSPTDLPRVLDIPDDPEPE